MKEKAHAVSEEFSELVRSAQGSVLRVGGRHPAPSSGVVWSADGILVTAGPLHESRGLEVGMPDFSAHPASLVGSDPATGISVIRVGEGYGKSDLPGVPTGEANREAAGFAVPKWKDPGSLEVGNLVLALGRPGRSIRACLGIASALGDSWTTPGGAKLDRYIQTDIALPPGFAGGPLLDMEGCFIGINSSSLLRGCTLAIPYATLRKIVETLLQHGRMRRGYLGVVAHPVRLPAKLEREAGRGSGLVLLSVEEEGPAEKAGLLVGDVLLSIEGKSMTALEDLLFQLGETEPGVDVRLGLVRGGKVIELQATVGERG